MRWSWLLPIACLAVFGCPPSDLGPTCHFSGENTACGKCIASACRNNVDGLCAMGGNSASDALDALDECATGKGCSRLDGVGLDNGVSSCVEKSCARPCAAGGDAGAPSIACQPAQDACGCAAGSDAGPDDYEACGGPDTICCAAAGWPADGTTCACYPIRCLSGESGSSCACGLYRSTSGLTEVPSCRPKIGFRCCAFAESENCRCDYTSCPTGATELSSCSADSVPATCSDSRRVSKCR